MQELLAAPARLDPTTLAGLLQVASDLAWQQHDFDAALNYAQRAADLGRSLGSDAMHLAGLHRLGRIYIEKEEYLNATETLAQTLDLARQQPHELPPSLPLTQMGELALFQGQLEDAQALLLQAEGILPPGEYIFRAMCLTDLAEISIAQGDLDAARGWLALALDPAGQHIRRTLIFLLALGGYLGAYEKENAHQVAACIYGALEGLSRRAGVKFSSYYRRLIEKRMAKTAGSLPPDEWQLYFETGRAWSRDQALAQAKQYLS
jgi:tetratricopeptide (TPR) repeat protein